MKYNGHDVWKLQVLWGKQHGVIIIPSPQKLFIERNEIIILSLPEKSTEKQKKDFLKSSMKKTFKSEIEKLMPKWEKITGIKCTSWFIGKSTSAWGWCRPSTGRIMLNEKLVYKPKECLEYVILHELCHLEQTNHGPLFAALLNQYMPDWRELEILSNGCLPGYSKYK